MDKYIIQIKEYLKRIKITLIHLIRYTILIWKNNDNDFCRVLETLRLELETLSQKEPDNKELRIIIEHLNHYSSIYDYVEVDSDPFLDAVFGKERNEEIEKLEKWHFISAFKRLFRLIKKENS